MEPFVVKHYSADERPTLKGNGFDGLEIGETREEAEAFVARVNELIAACHAVDTFFVFFDSHIPPDIGAGARQSLMMARNAVRA